MTGAYLLSLLKTRGCEKVRQKGSHAIVKCGQCQTVVPMHRHEDLGPGLLRAIERQLEPCLGKGRLERK